MLKTFTTLATVLSAAISLTPAARAQNIVSNPGFEADNASSGPVTPPTGWTVISIGGIADAGVLVGFANSGSNAAYIGYGTLSQTLTTTIGATYTVSFFVGIDDLTTLTDPNATFDATVSGINLGSLDLFGGVALTPGAPGPTPGSFVQCPNPSNPCSAETSDTFTAEDTATVLSFTGLTTLSGSSPTGVWYLDDVDVEAVAAPEPSALLVLVSAFGLTTLARLKIRL